MCFTSQEKELHYKPSLSIYAATQTSITAPVLQVHGGKLIFLLHRLKEIKLLKGITTIRKIYIKSNR